MTAYPAHGATRPGPGSDWCVYPQRETCDPKEAFQLWLKRKQQQQVKERQLEQLKRLEEESCYYLHSQEESERAFKL